MIKNWKELTEEEKDKYSKALKKYMAENCIPWRIIKELGFAFKVRLLKQKGYLEENDFVV